MAEIQALPATIYGLYKPKVPGNFDSSSDHDPTDQKKFHSRCTPASASVESAPLKKAASKLTMKFSILALLTAALSIFPFEAHSSVQSHIRCGVMAGYHISVPFEYQNVHTEIEQPNAIEICNSQINRITFSVEGDNIRPVSTGSWLTNDQKSFSVIVEPREDNAASSPEDVIKALYDKSSYGRNGGYPAKPPQKIGGLTYIQGSPIAGEAMRHDFYLSSDIDGHLKYLIHCNVAGSRENGQCIIGYKPEGLDLSLIVGISAEDLGSYQDISDKALELIQSMITGRVLG